MSPDWVFPIVAFFNGRAHGFLIYLNTQTRAVRNINVAAGVPKYRCINQVITELCPDIIMNAETLLLNEGVRNTTI